MKRKRWKLKNKKLFDAPIKGKELDTNIQEKLDSILNKVKIVLLVECEKARLIQEKLTKTMYDLERNLKWTKSSEIMFRKHEIHSYNKKRLGHIKGQNPVQST